jgi:hypothetical protein
MGVNRSMRLRLVTFLGLAFALTAAVWLAWWWPKSCPMPVNEEMFTGYYRGFGFGDQPGFFGKNFFGVTMDYQGEHWEMRFAGKGVAQFEGRDADGRLRAEGVCHVTFSDGDFPDPVFDNVVNASYYDPQGKLAAQVIDGTGVQIYWARNGVKTWERIMKNGKTVDLKIWNSKGEARSSPKEYWP